MYEITKNGRKVDEAETWHDAHRVAEAFEEFYPDSKVRVKEKK